MPCGVDPRFRLVGLATSDGGGLTVPLTLTFCTVAPVVVWVMLPEIAPAVAPAEMRTYTGVAAQVPVEVIASVVAQEVWLNEISTPVGATISVWSTVLLP